MLLLYVTFLWSLLIPLTHDIQAQPNDSIEPLPWAQHADEYDIKDDDATATAPPGIVLCADYSTGSDDTWASTFLHRATRRRA